MGFATVQGRNIHYQFPAQAEARVRQGHNVLMVHGAFDNHRVWMHQYAYLERDHTPWPSICPATVSPRARLSTTPPASESS